MVKLLPRSIQSRLGTIEAGSHLQNVRKPLSSVNVGSYESVLALNCFDRVEA